MDVTGSFISRRWMAKNCIREVSKLLGRQLHMIGQRNKKPCPYDGFCFGFVLFPQMDKSNQEQGWNNIWRGRKQENHRIFYVFLNHNKIPSLTIFIPAARWASCCGAQNQSLGFTARLFVFWASEGWRPSAAGLLTAFRAARRASGTPQS